MALDVFVHKSAWIGLAISAPIGPIGIMCIRYTLDHGTKSGLIVGLGNSVVKAGYSMIAALGLGAFIKNHEILVKGFGGILLLYLAYENFRSAKKINSGATKSDKPFWAGAGLTIINPMTILALIGVFASVDLVPKTSLEVLSIGMGMIFGSMIWWFFLAKITSSLKRNLSHQTIVLIKQLSAGMIATFGLINLKNSLLLLLNAKHFM